MEDRTDVVSLRLPKGMLFELRKLAHEKSIGIGREVRWSHLAKDALAKYVLNDERYVVFTQRKEKE